MVNVNEEQKIELKNRIQTLNEEISKLNTDIKKTLNLPTRSKDIFKHLTINDGYDISKILDDISNKLELFYRVNQNNNSYFINKIKKQKNSSHGGGGKRR